jgi:hypothetical protein
MFDELTTNRDKFTADKIAEFGSMYLLLKSIMGDDMPSAEISIKLICLFSCNAMSLINGEMVNIGLSLFKTISLANSSCKPNVSVIFE